MGFHIKVGATQDPHWAYELGRVSGVESAAIGCNWAFAPIVDLLRNWRNPIIANRSFGADPDLVLECGKAYLRGMAESGVACAMKHFPGDGIDERDHHLSSAVNSLSTQEWDQTFGRVYAGMIDAGVQSVMVGHIMQPAYQRHFSPDTPDSGLLPGSLCKELVTDLLKGQLGFNGLVVTDASHMVGLTWAMKRYRCGPTAIPPGRHPFGFPHKHLPGRLRGPSWRRRVAAHSFLPARRLRPAGKPRPHDDNRGAHRLGPRAGVLLGGRGGRLGPRKIRRSRLMATGACRSAENGE